MNIVVKKVTIKNEELTLTNQRAIFWKRESALILSDIHVGKTGHFKKHGIPMPDAILKRDLERLETLIYNFEVKKLLIVGDLFHAEYNHDMETFKFWLQQFEDLELILIKGNHDRLQKSLIKNFELTVFNELEIYPFHFIHDNKNFCNDKITISGHTHPGVLIKGKGKQRLKLPCYQISVSQIVLPAFSLFTGLNINSQPKESVCYAFTEESIFKF